MEKLTKLLAQTVPAVVASSATAEEIDRWLGEPTDATCGLCGQVALRRFERLNRRCERCRRRYVEEATADSRRDPECPRCEGKGWTLVEDGNRWRRCTCRKQSAPDPETEQLLRAGVPRGYLNFRLGTMDTPPPHQVAEFLADPVSAPVLFVYGLQGRGKSHLATGIFRELLATGHAGEWRDCRELVAKLKGMIRRGQDEAYDAEIFRLRNTEILLLDDFGRERHTDYSADELDGLIRWRRMNGGGAMIVTSDWGLRGLLAPESEGGRGVSPDVVSRLTGLEVEITGPDRRLRAARQRTSGQEATR